MNTVIGFIAIASLVTMAIKEVAITTEDGHNQNIKLFLNITILVLVTLFFCLILFSITKILHSN